MTPERDFSLDFTLSEGERSSPVWISLKAKFNAKLAKLRVRNDDPTLSAEQTATLRGHIQCLKAITTALDAVPPKVSGGATSARN